MCPSLVEPYTFDGPYAQALSDPRMAMDRRHIYMLHAVLLAYPFRNVLELGSYRGASSTAFIEAINVRPEMQVTFCDVNPTDSLWEVTGNCLRPDQVRVTKDPSWNVLESAEDYDFVLVDANHDLASVTAELHRLVVRRPLCVMAHDTNATAAGYPHAEGAQLLKRTFRTLDGYWSIEDAIDRPGEETSRGLFLATTSDEIMRKASGIFERWSQ